MKQAAFFVHKKLSPIDVFLSRNLCCAFGPVMWLYPENLDNMQHAKCGVVFLHAYVIKWQAFKVSRSQHVASVAFPMTWNSSWRSFNCQASSSVVRTPTIPRDWRSARTCRWHTPQIHSKTWFRICWLFLALWCLSFVEYLPFIVWHVSSKVCHCL